MCRTNTLYVAGYSLIAVTDAIAKAAGSTVLDEPACAVRRGKPKSKRLPETAADAADNMEWTLTRRIDLADPQLAGAFVLEAEEFSDFHDGPTGVEHREIRRRRATLLEAKMSLESYHAQQNLAMSGNSETPQSPRYNAHLTRTDFLSVRAKRRFASLQLPSARIALISIVGSSNETRSSSSRGFIIPAIALPQHAHRNE